MKYCTSFFLSFFLATTLSLAQDPIKVLLAGPNDQSDGIGTVNYVLKKFLPSESINCTSFCYFDKDSHEYLYPDESQHYDILFMTYPLVKEFPENTCYKNKNLASIKIACSVVEMSAIPEEWTLILNTYFDAVVVPDPYLVKVYKESGVLIPIFCIPQGILVKDYVSSHLMHSENRTPNTPFTFGCVAQNYLHKNLLKLAEAFYLEFENDPKFQLKLHCKSAFLLNDSLFEYIKEHNISTIAVSEEKLSRENYLTFLSSLDCYVLVSKGEGFSITPREALAMGIPCILTNNTAQQTICATGYVLALECPIREPSFFLPVLDYVGVDFDCTLYDLKKALRTMYNEYSYYQKKAIEAHLWVTQYEWHNILPFYNTLFNPDFIIHDTVNTVNKKGIITTHSDALFKKYQSLIKGKV